MERFDHSSVRVMLALALMICAILSAGVQAVTSPGETSFIAAARRTPVVLGLRLEEKRGCLTIAALVQFRQERYGNALREDLAERDFEINESSLYPLFRRLCGVTGHPRVD